MVLNSFEEVKNWVLDQISSMKLENVCRLLDLVPCPFAYGPIVCKINPQCQARVGRRIKESKKIIYYCFYEDVPVVSEEIIVPVVAGLIALYLPEPGMIDNLARLVLTKNIVKDNKIIFHEMYMFSSTYLGRLVVKKDTCISCLYRNEVNRQKRLKKPREWNKTRARSKTNKRAL
jgi:hypothetical protein